MSYGWMIGLGDGLQSIGKDMMQQKLTEAREARAEEMAARREQRAADRNRTTTQEQRYVQRDGVWFEQDLGGEKNVLDERLAPENKVREFNDQEAKAKASAEKAALDARIGEARAGLAEKELANYDADRAFDQQHKLRSLESRARVGDYSDSGSAGPSEEEVVELLKDENKSTFDAIAKQFSDYTDQNGEPLVRPTAYDSLVRRTIKNLAARGVPMDRWNAEFQRSMDEYVKNIRAAGRAPNAQRKSSSSSSAATGVGGVPLAQ